MHSTPEDNNPQGGNIAEQPSPESILKKYWGYGQFRAMQAEIIHSILSCNDTIALLPTGGGKSVCFQVPAMCNSGVCIVISPLIALMKDQVYQLRKRNILACAIFSGMSKTDIDHTLDNCVFGDYKFLYVSPERLATPLFQYRVQRMNVSCIAIDEAHCISQWGYDFRPAYLQIIVLRKLLPNVPMIALTASATQQVVADIADKLHLASPAVFRKSFYRNNLQYLVYNETNKEHRLLQILKKVNGSGVVYMRNRSKTEQLAAMLKSNNISADYYHAGLSLDERSKKQDQWIQNKMQIIVATNAFGMGIDKPDVRIVIHLAPPESLEEYYQEAGRGGRDEQLAYAVMLYNDNDIAELNAKIELSKISIKEIKNTYNAICNFLQIGVESGQDMSFDFNIVEFVKNFKLDYYKTLKIIKHLEQAELLRFDESNHLPTRLKIMVDAKEMYRFVVANKPIELLAKAILRSYPGVYDLYVKIKINELAKHINETPKATIEKLKFLHTNKIIDFYLNTQQPQIHFLKERLHEDNMMLDGTKIKWQQDQSIKRIQSMMHYTSQDELCRSNVIITYFDEKIIENCGKCDVCIKREMYKNPTKLKAQLLDKLKQKHPEGFQLRQALDSISKIHETLLIEIIRTQCDDFLLIKNGEWYTWKK